MARNNAILVGDVGGTHARFAIVDVSGPVPWPIEHRLDLEQAFPTFAEAITTYIERSGVADVPSSAAIAVAGPVSGGSAQLTNRQWQISERALKNIGFGQALLINDFVALAYAVDVLSDNDACPIGPNIAGLPGEPISILGAGTGFGVSCLVRHGDRAVPIATEGGHIGFAPTNEEEFAIWRCLWKEFGRVSIERVLSGPGLENIDRALQQLAGRQARVRSAAQITADAIDGEADCIHALNLFCAIYGSVAGDFALAHGARGGVYIAGGIAQKILAFLVHSDFRKRFENKGRLSPFVEAIPTNLILNADAALLGAARAATAMQRFDH